MCGRYTLSVTQRPELNGPGLQTGDRFNIAPGSSVLTRDEQGEHRMMPWGFSPPWAKKSMNLSNARSETLREKPAFRRSRRCVLLADGWYEWQRAEGQKRPWYHHIEGELLFFAGLYNDTSGCAIVTRSALETVASIHHRQPVLLEARGVEHWLKGHDLFASAVTHRVHCHEVSTRVNRPSEDDIALTLPYSQGIPESPTGNEDLFE